MATTKPTITYDEFAKLDLRVAKVLEVSDHPNADKLIVLKIDLGDEQRQLVAGLEGFHSAEDLLGREIVVVTNLAPRKMRGVESNGMLLAATVGDPYTDVVVLTTAKPVPPGSSVS